VIEPRNGISFQGMYKNAHEGIIMLDKEAINEILKHCDRFITTYEVISIEIWKGF
jgi:hypothetical protein